VGLLSRRVRAGDAGAVGAGVRSRRRVRIAGLILAGLLGLCILACVGFTAYQAVCQFQVAPESLRVGAGDKARLTLYQWDCLLSYLGFHACYEVAPAQVEGLPPGSAVEGIEWVSCRESELTVAISSTTPTGTYEFVVRGPGSIEKVELMVLAP
jgi:hypothetical protein